MAKIVIEGAAVLEYQDRGQAAILEVIHEDDPNAPLFARIQSWISDGQEGDHVHLIPLDGKRVRVTVEVLP